MGTAGITVDTQRVRELAEAVRRAGAEAVAVRNAPEQLRGSMTAMAPGPALAAPAAAFLDAWQQALADATQELDWFAAALDLAAQLYDATEAALSSQHGVTVTGALR